jgi:hypothetical protein
MIDLSYRCLCSVAFCCRLLWPSVVRLYVAVRPKSGQNSLEASQAPDFSGSTRPPPQHLGAAQLSPWFLCKLLLLSITPCLSVTLSCWLYRRFPLCHNLSISMFPCTGWLKSVCDSWIDAGDPDLVFLVKSCERGLGEPSL